MRLCLTNARARRQDHCAPENLVGHPVSDARKSILSQEDGLDQRPAVTIEKPLDEAEVKFGRDDLRDDCVPPFGRRFSAVKTNASKLSWIAKNQRLTLLSENEVVVLAGTKSGRSQRKLPLIPR